MFDVLVFYIKNEGVSLQQRHSLVIVVFFDKCLIITLFGIFHFSCTKWTNMIFNINRMIRFYYSITFLIFTA